MKTSTVWRRALAKGLEDNWQCIEVSAFDVKKVWEVIEVLLDENESVITMNVENIDIENATSNS